jgi:PfaD family protein
VSATPSLARAPTDRAEGRLQAAFRPCSSLEAIASPRQPVLIRRDRDGDTRLAIADGIEALAGLALAPDVIGLLPAIYPEWLGDRSFTETHGCRFPYVVGEMARAIATPRMVCAAARAGFMAFYGSAGLRPAAIADGVRAIAAELAPGTESWGANLINAIHEPGYERAVVDVLLGEGVARMSASAFMTLIPAIVRFAAAGLSRDPDGSVRRATHVFAKVSRLEVARQFMSPPPAAMLRDLVAAGELTEEQAKLAAELPVAEDITAEADSGGHTDNRPLAVLLPMLCALRDALAREHGHGPRVRIGAAGGIARPEAVAAAFQLGAAYVLTGSVNQGSVESGLSELARNMLAEAGPTDVAMAPAADMFELGVKVQVLKRGTMFAVRAQKLYELFRARAGLHALTPEETSWLEGQLLKESIEDAWCATREFHRAHDPGEVDKAEAEPKHKMALLFRRYLFMGSQWAREGVADRRIDFQIWCGPAMGAFNDWVAGSFLEDPAQRSVAQIGLNLMEGAARATRAQQLRAAGVHLPADAAVFAPRLLVQGPLA